ncbi:MAG: serine/threonine protein kinase [Myxococcales bacterium]|nr:serine/threonine protein kinase [Myxococcales bacterium]
MEEKVSHPSAALRPDDTVPSDPKGLVCPECGRKWDEVGAPTHCPTDGAALMSARTAPDPMVGRNLEGRYTILTRLGAGSMGTVYRAKQHAMGREVAIKILRSDRALDETAKARFMREARANSLLASPNTVTVFDFGQSDTGECYLAMELLDGESLGQRLARVGRISPPVAVDAARQALRSLAEAHAKGIIHRDLKPDNLFFARVQSGDVAEEIVKVLDFGIAKMIDHNDSQPMGVVETQAGTVFGTPRYMSPEQAQGKTLDARSDLYSLAVILYQMLSGQAPFTDNDAVVVMARHIKSVPKPPSEICPEAQIPKELEMVVMRTLAKDPAERPASAEILAGELLAALEAQSAGTSGVRASITNAAGIRIPESMRPPPVSLPKPRRARWPVAVAALGALVLAGALVFAVMSRNAAKQVDATPTATTAAAPNVALTQAPSATAATPATTATEPVVDVDDPPPVTPESLPRAKPPRVGAPRVGRPPKPKPAPKASTSAAAPAPKSSSPYGIFE